MDILDIVTPPHPALSTACPDVDVAADWVLNFTENLVATMFNKKGRGLAAPQVGVITRIFCMKYGNRHLVMCNPVITRRGRDVTKAEEGCLSLPGRCVRVPRHKIITVDWVDVTGQVQTAKMRGMDARCVQHEIDHLNGVLITDKV